LYPLAPETFDFSAFDVVISSSSAFAKGIVTRPGSLHLCYCHTPPRFLWDLTHEVTADAPPRTLRRHLGTVVLHGLRMWDQLAARRVDQYIANSETTRARIRKYYRRDATVIHPPVHVERFAVSETPVPRKTYFLFVGRLSPYKRAGLAVETFNKLELPLVIAGDGRERARLQKRARKHVQIHGFVPEHELPALYAGARAVIFPSDDDFGLVPVEAMAAGVPVLALRRGGAVETIQEGVTGEFFDAPVEELLGDCVRRFLARESEYEPAQLRAHAARFSANVFRERTERFVGDAWENWKKRLSAARPEVVAFPEAATSGTL